MEEIRAGRSMYISDRKLRFMSSAIVGGCLSIAVGVSAALKRRRSLQMVWCFLGDMAATTGAFHEALWYAEGHDLPIRFVIEDNELSCDTPTQSAWGDMLPISGSGRITRYRYVRTWPHVGTGKFVKFSGF